MLTSSLFVCLRVVFNRSYNPSILISLLSAASASAYMLFRSIGFALIMTLLEIANISLQLSLFNNYYSVSLFHCRRFSELVHPLYIPRVVSLFHGSFFELRVISWFSISILILREGKYVAFLTLS